MILSTNKSWKVEISPLNMCNGCGKPKIAKASHKNRTQLRETSEIFTLLTQIKCIIYKYKHRDIL